MAILARRRVNKAAIAPLIKEAIIQAVQTRGRQAFDMSQAIVPVKTGFLKRSGKFTLLPLGCQIIYSAFYASLIEKGRAAGMERVKTYLRSNGSIVSGHMRMVHALPARHFIMNSVQTAFQSISDEFDGQLRVRFKNVVRK